MLALSALNPTVSYGLTNVPTFDFTDWDSISTLEKTDIITIMTANGFVTIN